MILLKPKDYYTQRNNEIKPNTACMPTSRVMFYRANGINYKNDSIFADDDYFMHLLNTPDARKFALNKYPWSKDSGTPPNEIHGMYGSYLDPIVIGHRVSDFKTDLTFKQIYETVLNGMAIMSRGNMPGTGGHAFVFIGTEGGCLLMADPWGDYRTAYQRKQGYLVPMCEADFNRYVLREKTNKAWGHVIL